MQMDRQWHIRQQLELLSSPTSIQYHRIESYSSIVEGVQRVRRILAGDSYAGWWIDGESMCRLIFSARE
jgi:hypothetical protein